MNVLVSLGIIVILAAVTLPFYKKYQPNLELNGVARNMASDLRYAQQLTLSEQVAYSVQFNTSSDSYDIIRGGATPTTIKSVTFPENVIYQQITELTGNKVTFNSYGAVSQGGTVVLININNKTSTINIKPSGYVQIQQ